MSGNEFKATGPIGPELLGRLLDEQAAALELYARQFCRYAEDVVQEALIELARQPSLPAETVAWLYRVVRNKAISATRSADRRQRHEAQAAGQRPAWFVGTVAGVATDGSDAQAATAALKALPGEQREVVIAHLWGGLTFQQIGRLMGTSDSTAHRRYLAALGGLRERLRIPCPKSD